MNIKKVGISAFLSISLLSPALSFAASGDYVQSGYITYVKANDVGNNCFLGIGNSPSDSTFQNGKWYCGNVGGQNILSVAKTAMLLQLPVEVILLGDGSHEKPVHAITIKNK